MVCGSAAISVFFMSIRPSTTKSSLTSMTMNMKTKPHFSSGHTDTNIRISQMKLKPNFFLHCITNRGQAFPTLMDKIQAHRELKSSWQGRREGPSGELKSSLQGRREGPSGVRCSRWLRLPRASAGISRGSPRTAPTAMANSWKARDGKWRSNRPLARSSSHCLLAIRGCLRASSDLLDPRAVLLLEKAV